MENKMSNIIEYNVMHLTDHSQLSGHSDLSESLVDAGVSPSVLGSNVVDHQIVVSLTAPVHNTVPPEHAGNSQNATVQPHGRQLLSSVWPESPEYWRGFVGGTKQPGLLSQQNDRVLRMYD